MRKATMIAIFMLCLFVGAGGCAHEATDEETAADTASAAESIVETTVDSLTESLTDAETQPEITPFMPLHVEREVQDAGAESAARGKYIYALLNPSVLGQYDLEAIGNYLAKIVEAEVIVADCRHFADAAALYTALCDDHNTRGGEIVGVQIFGDAALVPSFEISYCVQMKDGVSEEAPFLTDLFYGNLNNDPIRLNMGYTVREHFAEGWDVDLIPQWRVARLPLAAGEFAAFFRKYDRFVADTADKIPDLVSFSNPIFASSVHTDDLGAFLERADKELGILNIPYRLYANLDGDYPVQNPNVLGSMYPSCLMAENERGAAEFVINTHGDRDYLLQYIYLDGKAYSEYFLHKSGINQVLDDHAYYLDLWSCSVGAGMRDNLTTTALRGRCVGAFAATTIIANNGADRSATPAEMERSNFFYFYYTYLKALSDGERRSDAFLAAQQAYGRALMEDSEREIRWSANYQFNLYNLLAYHNFGVLEADYDTVTHAVGRIPQAIAP